MEDQLEQTPYLVQRPVPDEYHEPSDHHDHRERPASHDNDERSATHDHDELPTPHDHHTHLHRHP